MKKYKYERDYHALVVNPYVDLKAKNLRCFEVGDLVIDVYRNQLYKIIELGEWAVLEHVKSKKITDRSLCDDHFKKAEEGLQMELQL